jgi:hypothetical protein
MIRCKHFLKLFRVEPKDTILHRSTIKEKELNIELDKKANPPTEKKIFIKKFNNAKNESIKKKNISKYFSQNFFIEKYVSYIFILVPYKK